MVGRERGGGTRRAQSEERGQSGQSGERGRARARTGAHLPCAPASARSTCASACMLRLCMHARVAQSECARVRASASECESGARRGEGRGGRGPGTRGGCERGPRGGEAGRQAPAATPCPVRSRSG
eukprot:648456-Rhodomonas_salina.2